MKNILCFEGEWKFNTHKKPERFDLNSEPILRMLKEYHKCDAIYRHILTKEDLKLYIEYFNRNKREWNKIDIVTPLKLSTSSLLQAQNWYADIRRA